MSALDLLNRTSATRGTSPAPVHPALAAAVRGAAARWAADRLLRNLRRGRLVVEYWDGSRCSYGDAGPPVRLRLADPAPVYRAAGNLALAFGEGYMHGTVQVAEDDLEALFRIVLRNRGALPALGQAQRLHRRERNRRDRQRAQISRHYDVGDEYYRLFLDPTLTYSCGYFTDPADSLERAQQQKIDHILRKVRLQPGQRLLDIGCGWGHLAVVAATRYGASAVGVTLSERQLAGARQLARRAGVADRVRFELLNYQELPERTDLAEVGSFDRIVSVGMFEHVGRAGHARWFRVVRRLLAPDGMALLHTITQQIDRLPDAWVDRYVFPGGRLPTVARIERHLEEHGLWSIDRENLWQHYSRTLGAWRANHRRNREEIVALCGEPFYRARDLWLAASKAGFEHGDLGLAQFVFARAKPVGWPLTRRALEEPALGGPGR